VAHSAQNIVDSNQQEVKTSYDKFSDFKI